jgi:hypothetical protein
MANNIQKSTGVPDQLKTDRGNAFLITEPRIGIVKSTIDACHSGIIQVWIAGLQQSNNPEDNAYWIPVRYMSPFYGVLDSSSAGDSYGDFKNNPQSYGFWATPPDIGTEVICVFVNGSINQGYYIGCIPKIESHNMVPAVAPGNKRFIPNATEANAYGAADALPTSEINTNNDGVNNSSTFYDQPRPVHSYQAAILAQQGLIRDTTRGVISSSSYRETPSRVFGISTPGGEIYEGGFNNRTIKQAIQNEKNPKKFKVIGRTGGHSLVMDDGTIDGKNQQIRLRSAAGHQITMSDDGQTLFIIHSNGQSWIELNSEGAIDLFSTNSFNVRTLGDINFHADQNININAKKELRIKAESIGIESDTTFTQRVGTDHAVSAGGKHTTFVGGAMSLQSGGDASFASKATTFINGGPKINLNTGATGTIPEEVPKNEPKNHNDTTYSQEKGWFSSPLKLQSIVTRAPTHYPMAETNGSTGGVPVQANLVAPLAPPQPPAATQAVLDSAPSAPTTPVSTSVTAANANVPIPSKNALPTPTTLAMVSQNAVNNAGLSTAAATAQGVVGAGVSTVTQMMNAGLMKPGADVIVNRALQAGLPPDKAISSNLLTGVLGASTPQQLLNNVGAQASAFVQNVNQGVQQLQSTGALTPNLAPTQMAGMAMAVANQGISTVTQALGGNAQAVAKIGNDLASGNFAGGLADKLSSGGAGVAASIGGAINGAITAAGSAISGAVGALGGALGGVAGALGGALSGATGALGGAAGALSGAAGAIGGAVSGLLGSIQGKAGQLVSLSEQAFRGIESSFTSFKANIPNVGGGGNPVLPQSDVVKKFANIAQLEKEVKEASNTYFADKTDDNKAAWDAALQKLKQANQELEKDAKGIVAGAATGLPSAAGGVINAQNMQGLANKITGGIGEVATSATSGLNALPGGIGAMVNTVKNAIPGTATANPLAQIGSTLGLGGAAGSLSGLLQGSSPAAGLVNSLSGAVSGSLTKAAGGLASLPNALSAPNISLDVVKGDLTKSVGGITGKLNAGLGALGTSAGAFKIPTIATGTFNNNAIVAKAGSLVGDSSIPAPVFTPEENKQEEPNEQLSALEQAYQKVQEETAKTKELLLYRQKISQNYEEGKINKDAYLRLLKLWVEKADSRLKSQEAAEAAYAALLKGESAGDGTAT